MESSRKSSYHRKSQSAILTYLIQSMSLSQDTAQLLIAYHDCSSISQALDLFLLSDDGLYMHLFIPSQVIQRCEICDQDPSRHYYVQKDAIKLIQQPFTLKEEREKKEWRTSEREEEKKETCSICYMEYGLGDMFIANDVMHPVCFDCMNTYIKEEISNSRVERIRCPHCELRLTVDNIRAYVDNLTFKKFKTFLRNLQIQTNPDLKWCPNPKCSVVIMTNKKRKTTKCPKCTVQICNRCNREAHPRSSCDAVFNKEIQSWQNSSDIQKCKKCRGIVEKISGCNHMTCGVCRHQWCWLCGGTYSSVHFNSLNPFGCPGLQNRPKEDWGKCKILAWRTLLFLGFLVFIPLLLPFVFLACGPIIVGNYFWNSFHPYGCCKKFWLTMASIIIGTLFAPFFWIGAIGYYFPKLVSWCCNYFKARRALNQYSQEMLKAKLLQEAEENMYGEPQNYQ